MTTYAVQSVWTLGLNPRDATIIERWSGEGCRCRHLDELGLEEFQDVMARADEEDPLMLWLGGDMWRSLSKTSPDILEKLRFIPIVLVLPVQADRLMLEAAIGASVQQVLLEPVTPAQVQEALNRAHEAHNIYREMSRMAREVSMEREMLERKTDVCSFLFQFFIQAAETDNAATLAAGCAQVMGRFCGLSGLHIAWWGSSPLVRYVVGLDSHTLESVEWYRLLRAESRRHHPELEDGPCINWSGQSGAPQRDRVLVLPMHIRGRACGLLALHMANPCIHSRDMAQALDVVRRHLALALWEGDCNERFFTQVEQPTPEHATLEPVLPQPGSSVSGADFSTHLFSRS